MRRLSGRYFLKYLVSFLTIFVLSGFSTNVFAIEYGGIGARPAYPQAENPRTESIFVHILEPGVVQAEGVRVINNTAEKKTILVYGVDSTPSTGGAFACEQMSDTKDDVGAWIQLEKTEITVEAGQNELIPFTIVVPDNANVGEHNGCIVTEEKATPVDDGSGGVRLSFRTGLRVAITIPGELFRKLEITDFKVAPRANGSYLIQPKVKNLGNVSVDADVNVQTKYFFGLTLESHGGQYPILRDQTSDWNFELKKPFWGGWYQSSFSVSYDANPEAGVGMRTGKELTVLQGPNIWFFAMPTVGGLIIEILVLLVILVLLYLWYVAIKRKQWIKTKWVAYTVVAGDDIRKVAEAHKIGWKILAKGNKLLAPYTLTVGNTIKVPPSDD